MRILARTLIVTAALLFATAAAWSECGDAVPERFEECDDGNSLAGDCCSALCEFEPFGALCADDGRICTVDICEGGGSCLHQAGNAGAVCRPEVKGPECAPSRIAEGDLILPFAISSFWFQTRSCGPDAPIRLYPTGPQPGETISNAIGCGGWHTFTEYPASASRLQKILNDLRQESYSSPAAEAGTTSFRFTGGVVAVAFNNMLQLYNINKDEQGVWLALVAVYDGEDCSNPNGPVRIVGFATVRIHTVSAGPARFIDANIDCNALWSGDPRGPDFGARIESCASCDVPEFCTGSTKECPGDRKAASGNSCINDGSLCAVDSCDDQGRCETTGRTQAVPCRPSSGICDAAESCRPATGLCAPDSPGCCDANADDSITVSDALLALRATVGSAFCLPTRCDYNGDGSISASDALSILQASVGIAGSPDCPPG